MNAPEPETNRFAKPNELLRKYSATTTSTIPSTLLTWTIQRPLFGNCTANAPTKKNGAPSPSENAPIARAPRPGLCVLAIQAKMPVSTGPVQGDAIRPQTKPSKNAPL